MNVMKGCSDWSTCLAKKVVVILFFTCLLCNTNFVLSSAKAIPVAAGALRYTPKKWNNNKYIKLRTNCYAYALNMIKNPITGEKYSDLSGDWGIETGMLSGLFRVDDEDFMEAYWIEKKTIRKFFEADMRKIGYVSKKLNKKRLYKKIKDKKTFLVYSVTTRQKIKSEFTDTTKRMHVIQCADYHWYRQNSNGKWSHKRGFGGAVSEKDASGRTITNPQKAKKTYIHYHINPATNDKNWYDKNGKVYYLVSKTDYDDTGVFYSVKRRQYEVTSQL